MMTARGSRRSAAGAWLATHAGSSRISCPRMAGRGAARLPVKHREEMVAPIGGARMAGVVGRIKERTMVTMSPWTTMSSRVKLSEAGRNREIETRVGRTDETSLSQRASRTSRMKIRMRTTGTRASTQLTRETTASSSQNELTKVQGETGI